MGYECKKKYYFSRQVVGIQNFLKQKWIMCSYVQLCSGDSSNQKSHYLSTPSLYSRTASECATRDPLSQYGILDPQACSGEMELSF
jgi:hypothetical protein